MTTQGDTPDPEMLNPDTDAAGLSLPILHADRQQQVVLVEGEEVTAVRVEGEGGGIFLPLRPMCAALGIDYSGQTQRIRRHDVMAEALRRVRIETAGGAQVYQCLELESTLMWLATIEGRRVKESLRPRLQLYQRWVFKRVSEAFAAEAGLSLPDAQNQVSSTALTLRQVEQFGLSIAAMAREQLEFDQRLTGVQGDVAAIKAGSRATTSAWTTRPPSAAHRPRGRDDARARVVTAPLADTHVLWSYPRSMSRCDR